MTINKSEHEVRLTSGECYDIAYDIFYALKSTVQTHWVSHPETWIEQEKERTKRLKTFLTLANYPDQYNYLMGELIEIIENSKMK
jgi:hypothetical protein